MSWDLDLVGRGDRLKEKEIRLSRLRRPTAGVGAGRKKKPQQEQITYLKEVTL